MCADRIEATSSFCVVTEIPNPQLRPQGPVSLVRPLCSAIIGYLGSKDFAASAVTASLPRN